MSDLVSNKNIEEYLSDLYEVGISKSLGYLPLKTLTEICNTTIEEIIHYANINGLCYIIYTQEESSIGSGAIFVYHENMLLNILQNNKEILKEAGIPFNNVIDYIKYTAKICISEDKYPLAYIVIGKTFNDYRFR